MAKTKEVKNQIVRVLVSPREKIFLKKKAAACNLSLSGLVREYMGLGTK